jgi:hypothetical protein
VSARIVDVIGVCVDPHNLPMRPIRSIRYGRERVVGVVEKDVLDVDTRIDDVDNLTGAGKTGPVN